MALQDNVRKRFDEFMEKKLLIVYLQTVKSDSHRYYADNGYIIV